MATHAPPSHAPKAKAGGRPAAAPRLRRPGAAAQLEPIRRALNGGPIQRRAEPAAAAFGLPGRTADDAASPLQPAPQAANRTGLPDRLKAGVEAISGLAMDDVRVHRNSPEPARLGALAYAQGSDIHLGRGQEEHLPHEAWHVVQQKQGRVAPARQMKASRINDEAGLEAEADRIGGEAAKATPMPQFELTSSLPASNPSRPVIQMQKPRGSVSVRPGTHPVDQTSFAHNITFDRTISLGFFDLTLAIGGKASLEKKEIKEAVEAATRPGVKVDATKVGIDINLQIKEIAQLLTGIWIKGQFKALETPWTPTPFISTDTEKYNVKTSFCFIPTMITSIVKARDPLTINAGSGFNFVLNPIYTITLKESKPKDDDDFFTRMERTAVHVPRSFAVILSFVALVAAALASALNRVRLGLLGVFIPPVLPFESGSYRDQSTEA
jgi:hypothetical protein